MEAAGGVGEKPDERKCYKRRACFFFFLILLFGPQTQQKRIKKLPRAYCTKLKGSKNLA